MKFSDEINFIFLCSNPSMTLEQKEKACLLLDKKLDWKRLIERANLLGISPLLYKHLRAHFHSRVPSTALETLRIIFFRNTAKNIVQSKIMVQVLNLFEIHQIFAVPFKGPVLSETLYGSDSLRFFGDLDFLIHPKNIKKAKTLLMSLGYDLVQQMSGRHEEKYFHIDHALDFFHIENKSCVDLQWKLFRIYTLSQITLKHLEPRLIRINFNGKEIHSLGKEDLLFFLCLHGTKHHWEKLEYVTSISELIRKSNGIDWEYVLAFAGREGCKRMILLGLFLAKKIYELDLPERIQAEIMDDVKVAYFTKKIINYYHTNQTLCSGFTNNINLSFFQVQVRDSLKARILFAFRALTRPSYKEFNIIKIPFICYYFFKPIRLFYRLLKYLITKTILKQSC